MSGIAGVQTLTAATPPQSLLTALGRALAHRGPDGEGRHTGAGTTLLHTALGSDPSSAEQPFVESYGRIVVADGMTPDALSDLGPPGRDPRLVQPLPKGPVHGHSGYAIAVHDPSDDRLFLSRDRFGLRPLYYAETAQGLIFGSEAQAIATSGAIKPVLNRDTAVQLLQLQFTTGDATLFAGVSRVRPGETLTAEHGRLVDRHRAPLTPELTDVPNRESEAVLRLEQELDGAVSLCLADRARMGMVATGSVASLCLLAAARRVTRSKLPVFGACAQGDPHAKAVRAEVEAAGFQGHWVDYGPAEFWAALPKVAAILDDPGADYAAVPLYLVAERASSETSALLVPEGGSELFALYGRYRSLLRPVWLGGRAMRARGFLDGLNVLREEKSAWRDGLRAAENRLAEHGLTRVQAAQAMDCLFWLPNDRLSVVDRCLAAHGLEPRAPYLADRLSAFAFALPDRFKIERGRGGALLRHWLAKVMPDCAPFARHTPLRVPAMRWLAAEAARLGPLVARNPGIDSLCDPRAVERLFSRLHRSPSKRLGHAAWQLLFFALWHRMHIEGCKPERDTFACL